MLTLEHLNLVVNDIDETIKFYQAIAPHWKIRSKGEGNWYGVPRKWVHFGDDFQFLSFNDSGTGTNRDLESNNLGLSHFAFSTANLDAATARIQAAGFAIKIPVREDTHRKNIYFLDPDGYEVELVQYLSDIPSERNLDT
jgi:catechol 2,3-dioxygenase-like lactoylglutathione lyase family enzyme